MSGAPDGNRGGDAAGGSRRRTIGLAILPLVIFIALAAIFLKQLGSGGSSSDLPSALIGRQAPATDLAPLEGLMQDGQQVPGLNSAQFAGKVTLVNIWASWCAPCRIEHPLLVELGKDGRFQVAGLNYKDARENALRFLGQMGNPYSAVGVDPNGRMAIEWGVYGVPETFLVGKDGRIAYKHVGPLSRESVDAVIIPKLMELAAEPGS